jgi:hypothetical protein
MKRMKTFLIVIAVIVGVWAMLTLGGIVSFSGGIRDAAREQVELERQRVEEKRREWEERQGEEK